MDREQSLLWHFFKDLTEARKVGSRFNEDEVLSEYAARIRVLAAKEPVPVDVDLLRMKMTIADPLTKCSCGVMINPWTVNSTHYEAYHNSIITN